jgi:hypothetical protein
MRCRAVVVIGIVAVLSSVAQAQPAATPPQAQPMEAAPKTHTKRYGTSIAVVDALSIGVSVLGGLFAIATAGTSEDDDGLGGPGMVLFYAGFGGYVVGGPFFHYRHHNNSGALMSLGLRLAVPVGGWLVARALIGEEVRNDPNAPENREKAGLPPQLWVAGMGAAMLVDWFLLAKVKVATRTHVFAAPTAGGGASFGLGGRF